MIQALVSLQRLWYLILFLSTVCLVADITLSSTWSPTASEYRFYVFPLALTADVPTVLIFAYCIWGKTNPLLLPSSSPKSNMCTRCLRGTGSVLLVCLWIANTILYSVSQVVVRTVLAGVAAMIAILIFVEMIGSARLGRHQRRLLKQERWRQEQERLDLDATSIATEGSISEQGKGSTGSASAGRRGKGGGGWGMDSREGLLGDTNSVHAADVAQVEIVRPPSVGAAQVIFNQQLMYEMYQQQYHQYHQQFLMNQQPIGTENNTRRPPGAEVEGKYDDLLLESSFKIEIPLGEAVDGPSSAQMSILESVLVTKKVVTHPPSAPAFEKTLPSANSSVAQPSSSTTAQKPSPAVSIQPKARPRSIVKENIQQDTVRILQDSNPFAKGGGCVAIQESASAPPIEPSSKLSLDSSMSSSTVLDPGLSENKQRQ